MALHISDRALSAVRVLLGVSQQQVSRWADPQSGLAITLRDINVLAQRCPEFGAALLGLPGVH